MKTIKLKMTTKDTAYNLFQECKKLFHVYRCWDEEELKKVINDRTGNYEIEFRDTQEADENLKNLAANDLKEKGIIGITLPERLKMELVYWEKYKEHLDIQNITICSGSRNSVGGVPSVGWSGDRLRVGWCYPADASGNLRSRGVVSKTSIFNLVSLDNEIIEIQGVKYKLKKLLEKYD